MRWSPSCRRWVPPPRSRRPRMPEQHHLIVGPVITEKSSAAFQARKEYAFRVQAQAPKPEKSLVEPRRGTGGRNNKGHITARYRGGGHKRQYRRIDFRREKFGVPAKVAAIEYDPNRTARIALLFYADGEKRYILAPQGL